MTTRSFLLAVLLSATLPLPALGDDGALLPADNTLLGAPQHERLLEAPVATQDADIVAGLSLNEDLLNSFVSSPGARIEQGGAGNSATIIQQGASGNVAFSATDGSGNSVTILQSGSDHLAGARIFATDGAAVSIDQGGIGHRAAVIANEAHAADISVVQRGAYESVTIEQNGAGQPIHVTQGY